MSSWFVRMSLLRAIKMQGIAARRPQRNGATAGQRRC
jgi:hypothetical protein